MLTENQKNQVLKINVSGKGVIPYEKIDSIDALLKQPENGIFFQKRNFLVRSKDKWLMTTIMKIQKNCRFCLKWEIVLT